MLSFLPSFYNTGVGDDDGFCVLSQKYLECLKEERNKHHKCRDLSKEYLQCRMDRQLMANEDLDKMGFSKEAEVKNAEEYDKSKEREGYVAGKHIDKPMKWWFQRSWGQRERLYAVSYESARYCWRW